MVHVIGLTGGIASGKSTVGKLLVARGAAVVDADQLARKIVEPGQPALVEIIARFGAGILTSEGTLDRKRLGAIVFSDPAALAAQGTPLVVAMTKSDKLPKNKRFPEVKKARAELGVTRDPICVSTLDSVDDSGVPALWKALFGLL